MSNEGVSEKMVDINDILNTIKRVNESFIFEIWVPSLNKNVNFREINTNQQKRLVKAVIDSPVYNTQFIFTLKQIIQENCVDDINVDNLTILDKLLIAMKLRSNSIGDVLEIEIPVGDNKIKRGVSLTSLLDKLQNSLQSPEDCTIIDDKGIFEIECGIPTILTEYNLEKEMRNKTETADIKTYEELRATLGNVFINELSKYIKKISISKKEDGDIIKQIIDFSNLSFGDREKILEQLPERITNKVLQYMEKITKQLQNVTLVSFNVGTDESPEIKEKRFNIDASFFIGS